MLITATNFHVRAQDTLCLYYSGGEFRLSQVSARQLDNFLFSHELKKIDSIQLIGYADSTGQKRSNQKLSEKRAIHIRKHIRQVIQTDSMIVSVLAKGGESQDTKAGVLSHRRVEIILFYPTSNVKDPEPEETNNTFTTNTCYRTADSILALCDFSYFSKGNRRFIQLEIEASKYNPKQRCYSLSAKTKYPKLVKWEQETTGELWWKRPRYIASIKAVDFERYGIVQVYQKTTDSTEACVMCSNDPVDNISMRNQLTVDAFLLQNIQLRKTILPQKMELVVPKEYVSVEKGYYLDNETDFPINWEVKPGRRSDPYYFAYIPIALFDPDSFAIYTYKPFCNEYDPGSGTQKTVKVTQVPRGTRYPEPEKFDMAFGTEIGYSGNTSDEGYVVAYLQPTFTRFECVARVGITSRKRLMTQLEADYHFWHYALFREHSVENSPYFEEQNRSVSTYCGTSISLFPGNVNAASQDVHLGISYWNKRFGSGADRFFTQFGLGFDYTNSETPRFLSTMVGVRFRI